VETPARPLPAPLAPPGGTSPWLRRRWDLGAARRVWAGREGGGGGVCACEWEAGGGWRGDWWCGAGRHGAGGGAGWAETGGAGGAWGGGGGVGAGGGGPGGQGVRRAAGSGRVGPHVDAAHPVRQHAPLRLCPRSCSCCMHPASPACLTTSPLPAHTHPPATRHSSSHRHPAPCACTSPLHLHTCPAFPLPAAAAPSPPSLNGAHFLIRMT